jgi:hypothetical protein
MPEMVTKPCDQCGKSLCLLASQFKRGRGKFCSRRCHTLSNQSIRWGRHKTAFKTYFWKWVDASGGADACWPWIGGSQSRGYGRIKIEGKSVSAHRLALTFTIGEPPIPTLFACHECDNPICCNPRHLRWDTAQGNSDDRARRGRDRPLKRRRCDHDEVRRLRAEGLSYSKIAGIIGINQATVGKILTLLSALEGDAA